MGNKPSESDKNNPPKCCKCGKTLPLCRSFDDFYKSTVNGRYVFVFNGGEYYRPVCDALRYECEYCFNKPIRDHEEQRREEERKREEERQRREDERRREEEQQRKEEERRREVERQRREDERRREEEQQRREEERRREEEEKRRAEEEWGREVERQKRREEKRRKREEERRTDQERRRQEERRRKEEEKRRAEEEERREEERQKKREEKRRRREEERRRDQERRRQEESKRKEEEKRRAEEEQRREEESQKELNHKLQDSHQRATEQLENQLNSLISEEHESKQHVLISHVDDEFEAQAGCRSDSDELLEILSLKSSIPVSHLSVSKLTAKQQWKILTVLKELLFGEWISSLPSLSTLQHTQVFITEFCIFFGEMFNQVSLQCSSNHVQSLVELISQSACNDFENFLLTQALYLTLTHFINSGSCDTDAIVIAEQWAEDELSTECLFLLEFLSKLTFSLQESIERVSVYILKMEIQCLTLLLSRLTHLNGKEAHLKSTEMVLRIVQTNQWTPKEAVTLLKALSQKYAEDDSITEVLTLVQVHNISPQWTDESGCSLIQALDFADPERFLQNFQHTLRGRDESSLPAALEELKLLWNLDDSEINMIKSITTDVLQYLENAPKDAPFMTDSFKTVALTAVDIQNSLFQLCKAVFDTKGWWPPVRHMLRWCALVLTQKSGALGLAGVEEDPCVIAIFAATRVRQGDKLDIVLSSDVHTEEQSNEWSDFYKHLGISLNTNMRKTKMSSRKIYEADVVYGTMDDFVSDYFQHGIEMIQTGNPLLSRGFIIEKQSVNSFHTLDFSRLKNNDFSVFAAEVLQKLMNNCHSKDVELRQRFIKAFFQVLRTNPNRGRNTGNTTTTILKKITGKTLPSNELFILIFLEDLFKAISEETEREKRMTCPAGKWCLESLFFCAEQLQESKEQTKELFQMVLNLEVQKLWSPVEALELLGALTNHHYNRGCVSIMRILHLMATYQVSSNWTDENNNSLLKLLGSSKTKNLISHLEKSLGDEEGKNIDTLFDEIRQLNDIDEHTLIKSYSVVTHVTNLIQTGDIKNYKNVQQAKELSHHTDKTSLQEILAVLCNAVHQHKAEGKWWPRAAQMISWCLLALSDTGKLLEIGTGEGKSCVIAMFAVLRALRGEHVDVVSSSSVLCQRDAEEWTNFFNCFGLTADTNTNKTEDEDRKKCYQKNIVFGTIEAFAADHLRQVFEMKEVRPDRRYECIIIDEVDSLLLDQGVQLTYLSSPMVSMQHLNVILAMIWSHVSQYGFMSTGQQTFVRGPPASFFKAIFDSIDPEETEMNDALDILRIAEESSTVPKGFREDIINSKTKEELLTKLKTVNLEAVVNFFQEAEQYFPYGFTVYTLDDKGFLCLRKHGLNNNQDIQELTFLVLEEGLCCPLYKSEEMLIELIAKFISDKIQYTPCTNNEEKVSIPGFLKNLIEKKLSMWVRNAFLATQLQQEREYVVENNNVCPVDFRSTGIVELNKKWGNGLQQFVEIKHQIKLSTISTVTNFISNISFFEKYSGKIYGTTGTLGSKTDILILQNLYPSLSVCKMPTFNRKKLFEVEGSLKTSAKKWKSEIIRVVKAQVSPKSYRDGRAALVICETINKANEIYKELKSSIKGEVILYCRSDKDCFSKIDKELLPGDVIVATNLAGRGTDMKVSKQVNNSGGLFVILSFLSENTRVELQAFGRTARKGKPGSAQIIMSTEDLQQTFRTVSCLEEAKRTRDRLAVEKVNHMMNDVTELKKREDLFSEYCKTLQGIHKNTDEDDRRAVVAIMNEFWGIWLQTRSEEIDQLKTNELLKSLKADLSFAKSQSQSKTSPCSSFYHYIKFGNIALSEKRWDVSTKLFEKAMKQDESWAAIAFYSHAYCTLEQRKGDYLTTASDDLKKAQESLKYLSEEFIVCLQFVKMGSAASHNSDPTSLEKQLTTKCIMLSYFDKNISEATQKLDEIKKRGMNATAKKAPIFSVVSSADKDLQEEAYNLHCQGLKYVFSVTEEPRFPWGALLVVFIGVAEIIVGTLLITFTYGALAQVGMELINEGISDCIHGIESMVRGEFSWKSWAIQKAVSIGVSLIAFGVGKLIAKGFKGCKMSVKEFGKEIKLMPKFLSKQAKEGFSVATTTILKNAMIHTGKKMTERIISYGLMKAEEAILTKIMDSIKDKVKEGIDKDVKSNLEKEPLDTLVDIIILSHIRSDENRQCHGLLENEISKSKLLAIFRALSDAAIQPFYKDLGWQNKLNSSFSTVITRAKAEAGNKACKILTCIQLAQIAAMAEDAISAAYSLSSKFFSNFTQQLTTFKEENGLSERVKVDELSDTDSELLKKFRQDLADTISASLADALVEVFHQKFSSHIISHVQGEINRAINQLVRAGLKSDRTEELLRAGQNNRYIAHMPRKQTLSVEEGPLSQLHAENIRNSMTAGTILDIRVLSEATGTKVVILTEDSHGRLTKMQELSPDTEPATKTVTLVYRPKSTQNPDGHYDVHINNQTVNIVSEDNSCLFQAFARGMNPQASEAEIASEAARLRSVEADTLLRNPGQWEPFVKRKEWTEAIRGGDWFIAKGTRKARKLTKSEEKDLLNEEVGKVEIYAVYKKYAQQKGQELKIYFGEYINADHQPPVKSILEAITSNQNSQLAKAMLAVAAGSSSSSTKTVDKVKQNHGLKLPTVYVPFQIHHMFLSSTSPDSRKHLAETISKDDVVGMFKLTILCASPKFKLMSNNFKDSQNNEMSKTRLYIFENSYPQHSIRLVTTWYDLLKDKGVMTREHLNTVTEWIDRRGYDDQNDEHRKKVFSFIHRK